MAVATDRQERLRVAVGVAVAVAKEKRASKNITGSTLFASDEEFLLAAMSFRSLVWCRLLSESYPF